MAVTKTITLYTFDELSDAAKEKARDWWRQYSDSDSYIFEHFVEDAAQIGLEIKELSDRRPNRGDFTASAIDCAQAIIKEHGETCETYKTAKNFLLCMDRLNTEHPEGADGERNDDYFVELEEMETEFLRFILEDYRVMLNKDYEYQNSDEVIDETMRINEYTFTESGKRED